ncbi:hypothetical protein [Streptomyces sp. NPDC020362]|uniref:NucA/NucB deoxyribonuclease domain-containing protein n=1 Tax=unclassified Streptomyces TaxID=2593676 RepID=UPI0033FB27D9
MFATTRHDYCIQHDVTYTLYSKPGEEIGHATMRVVTKASPNARGRAWTEDVTVTATEVTSRVGAIEFALRATCSGQCTMNKPHAWDGRHVLLNAGESKHDFLLYWSDVAQDGVTDILPTYYTDVYSVNETEPGERDNGVWNGVYVRCDDQLARPYPGAGCIVSGTMANVDIPKSSYGAAAVTYEWAQNNLTGNNFGTKDKPLQRDASEKNADNRRAQSCDRAPMPFVKDPTVTDDSCDEFPFAKSTQGGTNGSLCAEITPRLVSAGVWTVQIQRNPAGAPCVRSHVPQGENTGAGGQLGRAVVSERILDHEWYAVTITP